jgi:hypothetical protein
MQLGDELIDMVAIPPQWEKDTAYILYLREELLERNADTIEQSLHQPQFYIEKGFTPLIKTIDPLSFAWEPSMN